ncbi:PQ-loop-domain-containing protein [Trichodelitschia bisporula]|uniref:PQ-loop-domain-containing protein n=1 Tax=Trichodelitschia bisporula TaxID=703511 RepID=A0A6G1I4P6_9PEZI|nr:PQ-loop-domain-containing protein [Trichodelitschia bisporula]
MYPPAQGLNLDIAALSGICGSISLACWVVVFSPQIVENFRRKSAEGLSVVFIVVWLAGDVFNIAGAVLQGVLPTMIILAVYYTLADLVLLGQLFYYEGFTLKDKVRTPTGPTERTSLLPPGSGNGHSNGHSDPHTIATYNGLERRSSASSLRAHILAVDGTHLSPVTPLSDPHPPPPPPSALHQLLQNLAVIGLVCFAGVVGWYLSTDGTRAPIPEPADDPTLHFNVLGQVFGWICAGLYLGSRVPQLLLNYRRKSTEGISMLFFLFACVGNLTYVLSIMAYDPARSCREAEGVCTPGEKSAIYLRYVAVNASWLVGSFGTLGLDVGVLVQFFVYGAGREVESGGEWEGSEGSESS